SSDISEIVYEPIGVTGRMGFILAFLTIVLGITLMQSFIYKALFNNGVQGIWNHLGGIFIGAIEGGLTISVVLIIMSIYMKIPSDETKATSVLYKPLKNFAPIVFDQINTFLPESEDFYQQMFKSAAKDMRKGEKKQ
ncbi:MAG: CvpA family protein, partial [Bacteroidota bacterium]|nr:CvpA family protein [Bacteroidota bacterium]